MRATVIHGTRDIRVEEVADPRVVAGTDAVVRVAASCVCGSDLWRYRGVRQVTEPSRIGHEFVGVVEEVGPEVRLVRPGQFVIAPFSISDNTCVNCRHGVHTSCEQVAWWGNPDHDGVPTDGGQGEYVRVPLADGTLVPTPEHPDDAMIAGLLTLSDVMGTGHHAALSAGVTPGCTVAVVGDGAVGLCAVLAARRLGAGRVVAMSRNPARQLVATAFGATDVVASRGPDGVAELRDLLGGTGADCALECVGTEQSMQQALDVTRPGGRVGFVGVPAGGPQLPVQQLFATNVGVCGGVAPVRAYLPELLAEVWAGTLDPGPVFDLALPLEAAAQAYAAMDERTAIKAMLRP